MHGSQYVLLERRGVDDDIVALVTAFTGTAIPWLGWLSKQGQDERLHSIALKSPHGASIWGPYQHRKSLRPAKAASNRCDPFGEGMSMLKRTAVATLAALFEDHIRVVQTLESSREIRMSNHLLRILSPYGSSLGKAIAAHQS